MSKYKMMCNELELDMKEVTKCGIISHSAYLFFYKRIHETTVSYYDRWQVIKKILRVHDIPAWEEGITAKDITNITILFDWVELHYQMQAKRAKIQRGKWREIEDAFFWEDRGLYLKAHYSYRYNPGITYKEQVMRFIDYIWSKCDVETIKKYNSIMKTVEYKYYV